MGPATHGLAVQIREEVPRRARELLGLVLEHHTSITEGVVHSAVIAGLARALPDYAASLAHDTVAYFALNLRQFSLSAPDGVEVRKSLAWSLLELTPSDTGNAADRFSDLRVTLLSDVDPVDSTLAMSGGDLLTMGLNVVRGIATRASVHFLVSDDPESTYEARQRLNTALAELCGREANLSQRAVDSQSWAALFVDHLQTNSASAVDERLQAGFQYAGDRGAS